MGLFSSSYKYFAHAGSSGLFDEGDAPETVKSNIVQATTEPNGPGISNAIRFALGTDLYARSKSIMRYAAKEYIYGFPETDQEAIAVPTAAVQVAIESDVGEPVNVIEVTAGAQNEPFMVDKFLRDNYMNPTYFPWSSGDPLVTTWDASLTDIEIPVLDPTAVSPASPYYYAPNSPEYYRDTVYIPGEGGDPPTIIDNGYIISFDYTDSDGNPALWNIAGVELEEGGSEDIIEASFERVSTPGVTEYWTYVIGSNEKPALEAAIQKEALQLEYLPVIILMHDRIWFDEAGNAELEKTTDKILRRLSVDPYEIKEDYIAQVQDDIDSGNRPNKKSLDEWDFFIHYAVPIHTRVRGAQEYLYYFFQLLEGSQVSSRATYVANINNATMPYSSLKITEGGELGYNVEYRWAYIETVTNPGVFVNSGQPLKPNRMFSKVYAYGDADYAEGIEQVHGVGATLAPPGVAEKNQDLHHYTVITRQNADDTHTQTLMMAPSQQYKVNTREDPNKKGEYRWRYAEIELFPEDPEEDSEFRWPVHIGTLKEVSTIRREQALGEGFCATVYLVEKQEVKWYQKGFFKWLIIIIAVILIVLSIIFPGFIAAAALLLTTALGGGLLAFYILYAVLMFAVGFIIAMAGNLIGGTLGVVFAVIGAIATMNAGLAGAPGGAGLGISTAGSNAWGSAVSLINSTAPYIQGGLRIYQAYELEKLEADMKDFLKSARDKYEELKDAWAMFDGNTGDIDPLNLSAMVDSWYVESPEHYFSRTLNANPGVIGYDLINNFAEIALTLPEDGNEANIIDNVIDQFERQRGAT